MKRRSYEAARSAIISLGCRRRDNRRRGKLAEHWDVLQDEATKTESLSGLPMFDVRFPD
jgi:hypothetical protein